MSDGLLVEDNGGLQITFTIEVIGLQNDRGIEGKYVVVITVNDSLVVISSGGGSSDSSLVVSSGGGGCKVVVVTLVVLRGRAVDSGRGG